MSVCLPAVLAACVAISCPAVKICTIVNVERASTFCPMKRHGTEYRHRPTLTWMSGPIVARDHVASTKRLCGKGFSSPASTAWNTVSGLAPPNGRHEREPATSVHHTSAACCIAAIEVNSRPRQNESRT